MRAVCCCTSAGRCSQPLGLYGCSVREHVRAGSSGTLKAAPLANAPCVPWRRMACRPRCRIRGYAAAPLKHAVLPLENIVLAVASAAMPRLH